MNRDDIIEYMDETKYQCDVCRKWTDEEGMCVEGKWYLCNECSDNEDIKTI